MPPNNGFYAEQLESAKWLQNISKLLDDKDSKNTHKKMHFVFLELWKCLNE